MLAQINIILYSDADGVQNACITLPHSAGGGRVVDIDQQRSGGWLIQANFSDFYEQRAQLPTAIGVGVSLIADL